MNHYTFKHKKNKIMNYLLIFQPFFFLGNPGCPGQLTRATTNPRTHWTPCKPSRQVRHHGGDRRACWGSNLGERGKETLPLPLSHKFFRPFLTREKMDQFPLLLNEKLINCIPKSWKYFPIKKTKLKKKEEEKQME